MGTRLNQVIAIEKGIKSRVYGDVTAIHKANQKPELFNGFSKTYQPKDEEGETLPPEGKRVQLTTMDTLRHVERLSTELMDVTLRKDITNCVAKANVIVDGNTIVSKAPISYLLFLEKQVTDLRTLISNLPVLDSSETWSKDENSGLFRTEPTQTHRTRKVQKPLVLFPATPEHPAQTQIITEDVIAGYWTTTKLSGAIPAPVKDQMIGRCDALLRAIKQAREEANMEEVVEPSYSVGANIFGYVVGPQS